MLESFKKIFPSMFYINLDSRTDRNEQAKYEFNQLQICPERIAGTTISLFNQDPRINGAIGCTLSHVVTLLEAKRRKTNVFIFEDDIKFINNYEEIIDSACSDLQTIDWQMFYLGGNILKPFNRVSDGLARLNHCQSTHAYGVNYKFIDVVLATILGNHISPNGIMPLDVIYSEILIPKFNCYIVAPKMVAIQKDSFSDVENVEANYESYLEKRYDSHFIDLEE